MLRAAPEMLDVGAIISDSAYADLGPILSDGWTQRTTLPGVTVALGAQLSRLAGVDPVLKPVESVRLMATRAILFLHSSGDTFIPPVNARALRDASTSPRSRLVIFDSTKHAGSYFDHPAEYLQAVYTFIDAEIPAPDRCANHGRTATC